MAKSSLLQVKGHENSPVQLVFLDPSALSASDSRTPDSVLQTIVDKVSGSSQNSRMLAAACSFRQEILLKNGEMGGHGAAPSAVVLCILHH